MIEEEAPAEVNEKLQNPPVEKVSVVNYLIFSPPGSVGINSRIVLEDYCILTVLVTPGILRTDVSRGLISARYIPRRRQLGVYLRKVRTVCK